MKKVSPIEKNTPISSPSAHLKSIDALEVRLAFQERLTQDLSDQMYTLHKVIEALKAELEELKKGETDADEAPNIGPAMDPPPHY